MKTLRTHLDKIRSDAAECILLSKLVAHGKGEVFTRTAEHLNALAFELENTIATNGADPGTRGVGVYAAGAGDREATAATHDGAARHQPAARPRRMLTWLLVIVLGGTLGASFKPAREYWSLYASQSKHLTSPAPQDQTTEALAALLSGEHAERQMLVERVSALTSRVDNLITALESLKTARAEIAGQANKGSGAAEEKSPDSEAKPPAQESASEESLTSTSESLVKAKQSDRLPDPVDRVGAIPVAPKQAELDPRNSAVGPRGCTQFRSFDPVSGTYTTLDGRRRQCRQ